MLNIILLILKIIGLVILGLLGLILALLLIILLVPIRYDIRGSYCETYNFMIKVNWLLKIFSFSIYRDNETNSSIIRIFGIKLTKRDKSKKEKKRDVKKEKINEVREETRVETIHEPSQEIKDDYEVHIVENTVSEKNINVDIDDSNIIIEKDIVVKTDTISRDDKGIKNKKERKKVKQRINITKTIKEKFRAFKEFISKINNIIEFIKNEDNKVLISKVLNSVKSLLKYILPRKFILNLNFGTGDPALTGYILGLLAILYSIVGESINVTPDFENTVLQGDIYVKGKIRLMSILIIVIKLLKDKKIRKMIFSKNKRTKEE